MNSEVFAVVGATGYASSVVRSYFDDPVRNKIIGFGALKRGWDFGKGHAAHQDTIKKSLELYKLGSSYGLKVDAFPGQAGGINVIFYALDHSIEILVDGNNSLDLIYEVGMGLNFEQTEFIENIGMEKVEKYLSTLSRMNKSLWKLYAHSDWTRMIPTLEDFTQTYLEHTVEEYPYSIPNAQFNQLQRGSANI